MRSFHQRLLRALCALILAASPSWSAHGQTNALEAFDKVMADNFLTWDKNRDEKLSVEELDAAIEDPSNKGPAAAALAALKRAARATNYTLPPLTLPNIRHLFTNSPATNSPDLRGMFLMGCRRITNADNRDLFASSVPQLNTIRQGRMGDCFCLAPLGAMVHRDPREVASLFSMEADGRIRVDFGKGTVSVAAPTDAELAMTSGNSHDGVWVNLYEKAIGEARNEQRAPDKQADLAIDAIASGGSEGRILSYLTGHRVTRFGFGFAKGTNSSASTRAAKMDELRQKLADASRQGRLMACGTTKPTTPGVSPKHAYALLHFDSKNDTVDLWNPHGNNFKPKGPPGMSNGYPTTNGLFTVPLSDLVQQFSGMSFETKFADSSLESAEPADDHSTLKVGDQAPSWSTGKWIQGGAVKKFSPGKAYLVEFWASWCESCRISIPYLNELHGQYKSQGLVVIGQDCWEHDEKEAASFVKSMGNKMAYRIALEHKPLVGKGTAQTWLEAAGRASVPTAFLIDTKGRIAWIGHPLGLKDQLIKDVLAGTFDSQAAAAQRVRQKEARELFKQASDLAKDRKWAEAQARLDRLLVETNDDENQTAEILTLRSTIGARTGRWRQAADDLSQVARISPDYWNCYPLTTLLIQAGRTADYQAHCESLLDRFGTTTDARVAEGIAKSCLLLPSAAGPEVLSQAADLAGHSIAISAKGARMHWRLMTKGLADYRQGNFTNAIEQMELSQKALARERDASGDECKADTYFVMAMARRQLQQSEQARAALAGGLEIVENKLPKLDSGDLGDAWYDVLPTYILMREAKEAVEGAPRTEKRAQAGAP